MSPTICFTGNHVINAAVVNAGVQYRKAIVFVELGADPDLYGVVRIDKPFVRRGIEHGAVVELAAVGVGIGVSIEVHQRHFTKVLGMGAAAAG